MEVFDHLSSWSLEHILVDILDQYANSIEVLREATWVILIFFFKQNDWYKVESGSNVGWVYRTAIGL